MSQTRALAHSLRLRWEEFAARTGLRHLPPVPAALLALVLGVLLPFAGSVDAPPARFARDLALDRLARFRRAQEGRLPEAGPDGLVFSTRPAFFWPEHPGADSYTLRLYAGDGSEQLAVERLYRLFHLVQAPGGLEPGASYRFEVAAVVAGEPILWQEHHFTVRPPPEDLEALLEEMRVGLDTEESAFVLLGYYADLQSPADVISSFLHWKAVRSELDERPGVEPADWLIAEIDRLQSAPR